MEMNEIEEDLVVLAAELYFGGEYLISLEKEGNNFVIVSKSLPIAN